MLKKMVFVMAVALLTAGAYGRDYVTPAGDTVDWEFDGAHSERKAESWNWPATYDMRDICTIPVRMDVGFWIKVVGCKDKKLNLKQVEIHKYSGSVNVDIQTNVNLVLGVYWTKKDGVDLGGYWADAGISPGTLDAPGGTVTVSLTLGDVSLRNLTGGTNCITVSLTTGQALPAALLTAGERITPQGEGQEGIGCSRRSVGWCATDSCGEQLPEGGEAIGPGWSGEDDFRTPRGMEAGDGDRSAGGSTP